MRLPTFSWRWGNCSRREETLQKGHRSSAHSPYVFWIKIILEHTSSLNMAHPILYNSTNCDVALVIIMCLLDIHDSNLSPSCLSPGALAQVASSQPVSPCLTTALPSPHWSGFSIDNPAISQPFKINRWRVNSGQSSMDASVMCAMCGHLDKMVIWLWMTRVSRFHVEWLCKRLLLSHVLQTHWVPSYLTTLLSYTSAVATLYKMKKATKMKRVRKKWVSQKCEGIQQEKTTISTWFVMTETESSLFQSATIVAPTCSFKCILFFLTIVVKINPTYHLHPNPAICLLPQTPLPPWPCFLILTTLRCAIWAEVKVKGDQQQLTQLTSSPLRTSLVVKNATWTNSQIDA